ncbi:MAG TPA: RNA methyltransferase [Chitinophagaceae bacterium]|nr:RNA methyltransferase [Chitinophagaceae bacterium]
MLSKTQVKYIQSLSHKKFRKAEKVFIAEGPKIVEELLIERPAAIQQIYALPGWLEDMKHLVKAQDIHVITEIKENELNAISQLSAPNQVLAVVSQFPEPPQIDCKNELVIALDGIQDPGNLGTIIRIADWFGIKNIICSNDCADVYNSKVVQATMGSIARVNVMYLDLVDFLNHHKETTIFAAVLEGLSVEKVKGKANGILLIGNESKGISEALLTRANKKITIPKLGKAESLNAAVATGIILSHMMTGTVK